MVSSNVFKEMVPFLIFEILIVLFLIGNIKFLFSRIRGQSQSPSEAGRVSVYGQFGLSLFAISTGYTLYYRYPIFEPLITVLPSGTASVIGSVIELTVGMGATALIGVYVVHRRVKPVADEVRDRSHTVTARDRHRKWSAILVPVFGVPLWVALLESGLISLPSATLVSIVIVLITIALYLFGPFSYTATGTRDPTTSERQRLERCYDRFGSSPGTVVVFEDIGSDVGVFDAGRGSTHRTWVRESVLETATDDDLAVLLAEADEKTRAYYWEHLAAIPIVAVTLLSNLALLLSTVDPESLNGMVVTGQLLIALGGPPLFAVVLFSARRCSYRADDVASTHLGPETVRDVYLRCDYPVGYFDVGGWKSRLELLFPEPGLDRRIDRLTEEYALEPIDESETTEPHSEGIEGLLASMDPIAFTRFVADLRSAWGWECELIETDSERVADIVATDPSDNTRALIRTIHRPSDGIVTRSDLGSLDEFSREIRAADADSGVIVTDGRFAADLPIGDRPITLVDVDDLRELIEEAEAESILDTYTDIE